MRPRALHALWQSVIHAPGKAQRQRINFDLFVICRLHKDSSGCDRR
jgi:hypothetical protein